MLATGTHLTPFGTAAYTGAMADLEARLLNVLGAQHVLVGDAIGDDYTHDEALTGVPVRPRAVVRAGSAEDVVSALRICDELGVPVTARGAGTGLSGACVPRADGIVLALERMNRIVEIDVENHVAVVQPGVTLDQLDAALAPLGLVYPVCPGENSASLGGNVATNAGGMRAVKYGVTRHQVLGIAAVLAGGELIRSGGKFVKATTGYDLTQFIIGSEGTLAIVTEATLQDLSTARPHRDRAGAVPERRRGRVRGPADRPQRREPRRPRVRRRPRALIARGERRARARHRAEVQEKAKAYLIIVLEQHTSERLDEDLASLADQLGMLGAVDVYVLPPASGAKLIEAREKAFWVVKALGANDIIDVVVPRASVPDYLQQVSAIAQANATLVSAAGHAGDGNIHLSVFQPDADVRNRVMRGILEAGIGLGGAISAEHGIGKEKKKYFLELEDPNKIALMRRIKAAFDPNGILNPGTLLD